MKNVIQPKVIEKSENELNMFLVNWDQIYKTQAKKINLFKPSITHQWNQEQRKCFIKFFYHSRGHFNEFLWHLGNFAPDAASKRIVLDNIAEEFGENGNSHEQLYLDFAKQEGVDLSIEFLNNHFYIKEIKNFNHAILEWLYQHSDWASKLSAFAAYERLDAIDYTLLSNVLFKLRKEEHIFYKIHREAKHFDKTYTSLLSAWASSKKLIQEGFEFIMLTQLKMWEDLSCIISMC